MESTTYCKNFFDQYPVFNLHLTINKEIETLPNLFSSLNDFIKSKDKDFIDNYNCDDFDNLRDYLYKDIFEFTSIPIFGYKGLVLTKVDKYNYLFSYNGLRLLYVNTMEFTLKFCESFNTSLWLEFMDVHLNYNILQFLETVCTKDKFFTCFYILVANLKADLNKFDNQIFVDSFGSKICLLVGGVLEFLETNITPSKIVVNYIKGEVLLNGNKIFNYLDDKVYNYKDLIYVVKIIAQTLIYFETTKK